MTLIMLIKKAVDRKIINSFQKIYMRCCFKGIRVKREIY